MRDIHCPKDIGFENTFSGEDCKKEQHYNNCYHCWTTAKAKAMQELWIPINKRLPNEDKTVIASTKYAVYPEARYTEENGWEWAYESGADYWEKLEDVIAWMPLPKRYKPHESGDTEMTYEDIYNEFLKKFPNVEVEDYRPAVEMYIPQLSRGIPNAIIVWLKDGSKVMYIAESEETNDKNNV